MGAGSPSQVIREGNRTVVLRGTDYLQINGDNSASIYEGQVAEGTCTDMSLEFYDAVILALGSETGEALVSMRSDLLSRLDAANVAANEQIGGLNEEIETLQTRLRETSRLPDECVTRLRSLTIVLAFLERAAGGEMDPTARQNYARVNADRLREVFEDCSIETD